jgi:hypothetical protein
VEEEDGPFDRREPFQQKEKGHRQCVRLLGVGCGVGCILVGQQRLG